MSGFPFRQRRDLDRDQPAPEAWNQNLTKKGQAMGDLVKMAGDCEGEHARRYSAKPRADGSFKDRP